MGVYRVGPLVVAVVCLLALCPRPALACFCLAPEHVHEQLRDSIAVFTGEVVENAGPDTVVTVGARFRGDVPARVVVPSSFGNMCGSAFEPGRLYLFYATERTADDRLTAGVCDRTRPLAEARGDFAQLLVLTMPERAARTALQPRTWTAATLVALALAGAVSVVRRSRSRETPL